MALEAHGGEGAGGGKAAEAGDQAIAERIVGNAGVGQFVNLDRHPQAVVEDRGAQFVQRRGVAGGAVAGQGVGGNGRGRDENGNGRGHGGHLRAGGGAGGRRMRRPETGLRAGRLGRALLVTA